MPRQHALLSLQDVPGMGGKGFVLGHRENQVLSGGSEDSGWTLHDPLEKVSCAGTVADAGDGYTDVSEE